MGTKINSALKKLFTEQGFTLDKGQEQAVSILSEFGQNFLDTKKSKRRFFSRKKNVGQGVYIHGDVGRGKTMLMDTLYSVLPDDSKKQRVHFHTFMKDVHEFLHAYRQADNGNDGVDKALPEFANLIKKQCNIICFDEFHITDVADAMILSRLFTALMDKGLWVIMTSNWEPNNLYKNGLQRDRILPFIELIKTKMRVVELNGDTDYRKQVLKGHPVYFTKDFEEFEFMVEGLTKGKEQEETILEIKRRKVVLQKTYGDVAIVSFSELCEQARGAEDYLALAKNFTVIVLTGIPKITVEKRNVAKRFMILIDILYDAGCLLVARAEAEPDQLYTGHDHVFEFDRTVSRLIEMQSENYLTNALES